MKSKSIPVRPIAFSDETPASYLIRAVSLNGHKSLHDLVGSHDFFKPGTSIETLVACTMRYKKILDRLGLREENCRLVNTNVGFREKSLRFFNDMYMPYKIFRKDLTAFCPECLVEAQYWRVIWLLRLYDVCTIHDLALVDTCGHCNRALNSNRGSICFCNYCGGDFRVCKTEELSSNLSTLTQALIASKDEKSLFSLMDFYFAVDEASYLWGKALKMDLCYWFLRCDSLAIAEVSNMVEKNMNRIHPRYQLLSFLLRDGVVKEFAERILRAIPPVEPSQTYFYSIPALPIHSICTLLGVDKVYYSRMMKQGFLNYERPNGKTIKISFFQLDNIFAMQSINPRYLQERFAKQRPVLCINALEIAKKMDATTATVRALIKIDLLKTTDTYIQGERAPVVTEDDLREFQNTYVIRKNLAKILKTTPCYLERELKNLNIRPIFGPEIDGFCISVFNMDDIIKAMSRPVSRDGSFI